MNCKLLTGVALATLLSFTAVAQAQSGRRGRSCRRGHRRRPGGSCGWRGRGRRAGGIADDTRPRFRSYVSERRVPSYHYDREVVVGADLPSSGVTYYDVPKEYGVTKYRYTVVNDRTVLVDPSSHRIIQVIE
jgi:hypothetical protein